MVYILKASRVTAAGVDRPWESGRQFLCFTHRAFLVTGYKSTLTITATITTTHIISGGGAQRVWLKDTSAVLEGAPGWGGGGSAGVVCYFKA